MVKIKIIETGEQKEIEMNPGEGCIATNLLSQGNDGSDPVNGVYHITKSDYSWWKKHNYITKERTCDDVSGKKNAIKAGFLPPIER
jgi:hypothetical protein